MSVSGGTAAVAHASDLVTIIGGATIAIQSVPAGLTFTVDNGEPRIAPATVLLTQGSHTLTVSELQPGTAGIRYRWMSWSDGRRKFAFRYGGRQCRHVYRHLSDAVPIESLGVACHWRASGCSSFKFPRRGDYRDRQCKRKFALFVPALERQHDGLGHGSDHRDGRPSHHCG